MSDGPSNTFTVNLNTDKIVNDNPSSTSPITVALNSNYFTITPAADSNGYFEVPTSGSVTFNLNNNGSASVDSLAFTRFDDVEGQVISSTSESGSEPTVMVVQINSNVTDGMTEAFALEVSFSTQSNPSITYACFLDPTIRVKPT